MHIGVISIFPEMFNTLRCGGITKRALDRELLTLDCWNPRDFSDNKHGYVDDRPYGGGPGMVMQVKPLRSAIKSAVKTLGENTHVIYLSPQGRTLDHQGVLELAQYSQLLFVAGRYEGIDERLIEADIDEQWSIGDYVLTGGELAAMVMIDAITRQLPDALGHESSAVEDSFYAGLLDYPHYSRPEEIDNQRVPPVLLAGNHAEIARWRHKQSLGRTWLKRPDLLQKLALTAEQQLLLDEFINEYKEN